jgi:hypothetical protein
MAYYGSGVRMTTTARKAALDLSSCPPGTVRYFQKYLCLACIFDIYTVQLRLAPRTAYSEVKRHTPTPEELTGPETARPYFDSEEKNPHCPYCNSAKRWLARFETYRIEGGKATDRARRELVGSLPKSADQFQVLEAKSNSRKVFFEWLDSLGHDFNLDEDGWLIQAALGYLERKDPKTDWRGIFKAVHAVRPSSRHESDWDCEDGRLYLAPSLYNEVLLVQYLVSRSHKAGGSTFQGRLTLPELLHRFRYSGYLNAHGVTGHDQFEVFERLVDHLTGGETPLKLYFVVDRREFLEKLKTVYSKYAS